MATAIARRSGRAATKADELRHHLVLPLESEGSVLARNDGHEQEGGGPFTERSLGEQWRGLARGGVSCSETVSPGNGGSLRVDSIPWRTHPVDQRTPYPAGRGGSRSNPGVDIPAQVRTSRVVLRWGTAGLLAREAETGTSRAIL
jgi:hypothetical protein